MSALLLFVTLLYGPVLVHTPLRDPINSGVVHEPELRDPFGPCERELRIPDELR